MPATTCTGMPLGSIRSTERPPIDSGSCLRGGARLVGQPQYVGLVAGPKCHAGESCPLPTAQDHTWRTRGGAAQLKLVRRAPRRLETKGPRKRLGAGQVWLLELEPRDVGDFDHRIPGPAGLFAGERSLLAVQVFMYVPVGIRLA